MAIRHATDTRHCHHAYFPHNHRRRRSARCFLLDYRYYQALLSLAARQTVPQHVRPTSTQAQTSGGRKPPITAPSLPPSVAERASSPKAPLRMWRTPFHFGRKVLVPRRSCPRNVCVANPSGSCLELFRSQIVYNLSPSLANGFGGITSHGECIQGNFLQLHPVIVFYSARSRWPV